MNQELSPSLEDPFQSRAQGVAAELGETTPEALDQILRLLKQYGEEFVQARVSEALAIQAACGERLPNGGRARTLGGIFFRLARAQREGGGGEPRPRPTRRQPMPWEARHELLPVLAETKGRTMSVKVILSGRPGKVERREGTVVLLLAAGDAPPLPRGVPLPPAQSAPFACYLDAQQWAEVEPALADPTDTLILEGFCAGDPELGTVTVYVQSATTRNLQRASAANKNKSKRFTHGNTGAPRATSTPAARPLPARAEPPRSPAPPGSSISPGSSMPPGSSKPPPPAPSGTPSSASPAAGEPGLRFQKGMRVRHPQFGEGEVIRSEARAGDEAVTVDFASSGLRRVLARAAGLEIIGT